MKISQRKFISIPKIGLMVALMAGGLALTGCDQTETEKKNAALEAQSLHYAMLKGEIAVRDSMIDEMVTAFDKVDANLELIREKEAAVRDLAENEEASGDRKDRIVRDVQVINTLMSDNRKEIARLRQRIKSSGIKVSGLEDRLARMEAEGVQKDRQLAEFRESLASREQQIAGLTDTLNQREMYLALQETIIDRQETLMEVQENEINTAYFTTGSFKELKDRGLVEKKGALLGVLGGKKAYTAEGPEKEFIRIDQRDHTRIPVFAKKAELVTAHPANSYRMNLDEDGRVSTLEILNPKAFWESSRYLVVATN
jgi:chromosome segregation ATPase